MAVVDNNQETQNVRKPKAAPTHVVLYGDRWNRNYKTFKSESEAMEFISSMENNLARTARVFPVGKEKKVKITVELV